jgi:hypothetical protein
MYRPLKKPDFDKLLPRVPNRLHPFMDALPLKIKKKIQEVVNLHGYF